MNPHADCAPQVNGQLSQRCYLRALDSCYGKLAEKKQKQRRAQEEEENGQQTAATAVDGDGQHSAQEEDGSAPFVLGDVRHVLCHSPYNKLVQKSFARLAFADAQRLRRAGKPLVGGETQEVTLGKWLDVPAEVTIKRPKSLFRRPAFVLLRMFCLLLLLPVPY